MALILHIGHTFLIDLACLVVASEQSSLATAGGRVLGTLVARVNLLFTGFDVWVLRVQRRNWFNVLDQHLAKLCYFKII